jgi:hypothetical protein
LCFSEESTLLGQFTNSLVRKLAQQRCWRGFVIRESFIHFRNSSNWHEFSPGRSLSKFCQKLQIRTFLNVLSINHHGGHSRDWIANSEKSDSGPDETLRRTWTVAPSISTVGRIGQRAHVSAAKLAVASQAEIEEG